MNSPQVIWWSPKEQRGTWACCHMLNLMFDLYECKHVSMSSGNFPDNLTGAIIVIHGGNEQLDGRGPMVADLINEACEPLKWAIFVNIGDEQSEFCVDLLSHPNSRLWLQTPLPFQHANRYLIEGYTHGTVNLGLKRDLDWFFGGQVNHERRISCYKALEAMQGGVLRGTNGFGQGFPHETYIEYMNRARIVPCPSGPATPDSFRMAEALECGAIPIIDAQSLNPKTAGFWNIVLPGHPLPVIQDWSTLPRVMEQILSDYERIHRAVDFWWKSYKLRFRGWLAEDLLRLGAE